jgi:hypothetical protein
MGGRHDHRMRYPDHARNGRPHPLPISPAQNPILRSFAKGSEGTSRQTTKPSPVERCVSGVMLVGVIWFVKGNITITITMAVSPTSLLPPA